MDRAEILESFSGEFVFFVEVGSDNEESVVVEALEGLVEDLGPNRLVIPVVLVTKKGDVGSSDLGEVEEPVSPVGNEIGGGTLLLCFLKLRFPAGVGLIDFGGADVESLEVGGLGFFCEELGENAGFVATTAG